MLILRMIEVSPQEAALATKSLESPQSVVVAPPHVSHVLVAAVSSINSGSRKLSGGIYDVCEEPGFRELELESVP